MVEESRPRSADSGISDKNVSENDFIVNENDCQPERLAVTSDYLVKQGIQFETLPGILELNKTKLELAKRLWKQSSFVEQGSQSKNVRYMSFGHNKPLSDKGKMNDMFYQN